MGDVVGAEHDAWQALAVDAHYDLCECGCWAGDIEVIGRGESRRAYLVNGVVYKISRRASANTYEHEALDEWRAAGAEWAPPTTLWRFTVLNELEVVLAMPFLPDDGGTVDDATLTAIRQAAPQTCRENYVSHRGRTYLIDGGDIELSPTR